MRQDRQGDRRGQGAAGLLRPAHGHAVHLQVGERGPGLRHREGRGSAASFTWSGPKKLENKALREQFVLFAGEENKHKEKLQRVKSGSTFKPSAKQVTDLKIVDYLVDIVPTPDMDYQEALIVAMRREKASFKLYNDLAAMAEDEGLRETFLALAQEEAKHKLRLETEYEKEIYTRKLKRPPAPRFRG